MNVLIACEFPSVVRDAFLARGHDAWSCDLLPSEGLQATHLQMDVRKVLTLHPWDILIAFPPCTYLSAAILQPDRPAMVVRTWRDQADLSVA